MGDSLSNLVSDDAFWEWLKSRVTPIQLSEMYRYALMLKEYYVPKYHFSSILKEIARTSSDAVRKIITQDMHYQNKYGGYDRQFISSLLDYMDFYLKENLPAPQKEENSQPKNIIHIGREDSPVSAQVEPETNNPSTEVSALEPEQSLLDTTKSREKVKKQSVYESFLDFIREKGYENDDYMDPILYAKSFGTIASELNLSFDEIFNENISKCYQLRPILENQDDIFKTDEQRQRYHRALKYYDLFLESRSGVHRIEQARDPGILSIVDEQVPLGQSNISNGIITPPNHSYSQTKNNNKKSEIAFPPELVEAVRGTLENLSGGKHNKVFGIAVYQKLYKKISLSDIMRILENAEWSEQTPEGSFIYIQKVSSNSESVTIGEGQLSGTEKEETESISETLPPKITDNPASQPPWTFDESIILLDACINSLEHPENHKQIVQDTSKFLRNMALQQNKVISEKYRNENGIHFQMMSMESALAGKTIIKPATKRFIETVDFYLTQPEAFQKKILQVRTLYATDEQKTKEDIEKSCVMIDDKSRDSSENKEKDVPAPFSFHNVEDQFPATQRNNKPEPLPLYIIYQMDLSYLENKTLSEIPEMEKLWRALGRNQILDLFSLLRLTREDIENLKQFGQKKQQLLYQQLKVLSSVRSKRDEESKKSFLSCTNTNEVVNITINPKEEFDQEFIDQVHNSKEYIAEILSSIIDEVIKLQEKTNITKTINNLLKDLPEKRVNSKVSGFIQIFPTNNDLKIKMLSLLSDDECTISDFTNQCILSETFDLSVLKKFLLFCSFDITEEVSHLEDDLGLKMRWNEILSKKSAGETLQQIGDDLSVSRERIRQIDSEIKIRFDIWNSRHNLLGKVYACRECDKTITEKELSEHFGDKTSILIYLLKNSRDNVFTYDPQTKAFIYGDSDIPGLVQKAVDDLPPIIHEKQLSNIIDRISSHINAEAELISLCIQGTYKKTGDVYHKTRLKKKNVYKFILEKYFSEGMAVYDEEEIERFRAYVLAEFGDIGLPDNNRAISARLAAVGILCGRGIYMPKRDEYIPLELANRIYEYIITSDHDVFLMNTLFSVFETELRQSGVENKYYLQGILHELYGDKLFFSRDYVSKNSKITNIYDSVIKYIQKSKLPVSTQQIQSAFPGITPIVMSLATDHPDIIKLYGEFLHRKNLTMKAGDEEFLLNLLHAELSDQKEHHSKDLFEIAQNKRLDILNHLGIFSSYNFFSLLECLFGEEFQFERPYIANNGVEIGRATERIQAMIEDSDEILISEIRDFAVANHLPFFNYFDFINSQNKTHLMKNKNTLIRIEKTGIDDSIARNIESEIYDEAVITMLIRELTCVPIFPRINIPWNEWLIYSVLKKWSTLLDVSTTNVKYKDAIPVVARKNKLSLDSINTDNVEDDDVTFSSVDVDNIDELLEPFIHLYLDDEADDEF